MRRSILARLGLATAAFVVALLLAEGIVRVFFPVARVTTGGVPFVADDAVGFRLDPSRPEINAFGFRGSEIPETKAAGEVRVLALGDSQTFGQGVAMHETWPARLEALLRARAGAGRTVRVINAGVPAYGQIEQLATLRAWGTRLRPDAVVVGFFVGNDFSDNNRATTFTVIDGALVGREAVAAELSGIERLVVRAKVLLSRSHLVAKLVDAILSAAHERLLRARTEDARARPAEGNPSSVTAESTTPSDGGDERKPARPRKRALPRRGLGLHVEGAYRFLRQCLRGEEPGAVRARRRWERGDPRTRALLREIRDECEALGARLLVVVLPEKVQTLDDERLAPVLESVGLRRDEIDWTRMQRSVMRICREERIPAIDLLPRWPRDGEAARGLWLEDIHLSPSGQDRVARLVAAWLTPRIGRQTGGSAAPR